MRWGYIQREAPCRTARARARRVPCIDWQRETRGARGPGYSQRDRGREIHRDMRLGPAVLLSCVALSAGLAYAVAEHTPVFIVAFVSAFSRFLRARVCGAVHTSRG